MHARIGITAAIRTSSRLPIQSHHPLYQSAANK